MYYNPSTDRAVDIEVIVQQCRDAITRGRVQKGIYVSNVVPIKQETTSK